MIARIAVVAASTALALPILAGAATADVSSNGTTNDRIGYCNANHLANYNTDGQGLKSERSHNHGKTAVSNRQIRTDGSELNTLCTETQGEHPPISNNG